ncbi:MAG: HlyD family type I secretion periplasmic adaptor subunit [Caulobacteraceae bacterium]|nr:HlyD family type I secretion periplasmic adaptor subunit [Caulobacteraceae bacterium]
MSAAEEIAEKPATPEAEAEARPKAPLSDNPQRELRLGAIVVLAFFGLFLGWAAIARLDAAAYAQGVIAVAGNRQAVQIRDGGVVTVIHVTDGQTVAKGQALAEISTTEIGANERAMSGEVMSLLAQRSRLNAERTQAADVATPPEFAGLGLADRILANEAMILQRQQFEARKSSVAAQQGVLNQRMSQLDEQINGYQRQLDANAEQLRLIAEELVGVGRLAEQGYAPETRVRALEREEASLTGDAGSLRAQVARAREAIGESRMQLLSIDRQVVEEVTGQLRDVEVRLDELQPKLGAIRDQLGKAVIRAPAGGKVVGMTVFTVGGVLAPGATLMEIVPQDRALVIQASISPADADDLRLGQETQVRFTSLHERDLPILKGVLTKLSADSFVDEQSGQRFFRGEISVPEAEMERIRKVRGARTGLQAGLPVEILIPLRARSALDYLLEPLLQTFWKSGREH